MTITRAAVVPVLLFALAGCGGDGGTPEATETTSPPTVVETTEPTTPTVVETTAAPTGARCADRAGDGKDLDLTRVAVSRQDGELTVTWTTAKALPTTGTFLLSIFTATPEGDDAKQFGVKYQGGKQTAYFVFDMSEAQQENVPGAARRSGRVLTGTFPESGLSESFHWRAIASREGNDVDFCPEEGDDVLNPATITYSD